MVNFLRKSVFLNVCLFTYVIGYVLFPAVMGNATQGMVKLFLVITMLLLLYCCSNGCNRCISVTKTIMPFFLVFVFVQTFLFSPMFGVKYGINLLLFVFLCRYGNKVLCDNYSLFVKISSLVACIPVIYFCLLYHKAYFFRTNIFIEKQTLSLLLATAYMLCLVDAFFSAKQKKWNATIFAALVVINVFIIQSKSSLFVLLIGCIVLFLTKKSVRLWFRKKIFFFLMGYVALLALFPTLALPDDIRFGINRVIGTNLFSTDFVRSEDRMELTYSIRDDSRIFCFQTFLQHPIVGIGLGNFSSHIKKSSSAVRFLGEPESAWLSILTEGGGLYVLSMLVFFFSNIYFAYSRCRRNDNDVYAYRVLLINVCYCVIFFFNDFMDSLFWMSSGITLGAIYYDSRTKCCTFVFPDGEGEIDKALILSRMK